MGISSLSHVGLNNEVVAPVNPKISGASKQDALYSTLHEQEEISCEELLNKQNMSVKDQENMRELISTLKANNMLDKNSIDIFKKNISYGVDEAGRPWIVLGSKKWAKTDVLAGQNGETIVNHNGVSFFYIEEVEHQNDLLGEQGMEIPDDVAVRDSIRALLGEEAYEKDRWGLGGYLLSVLVDMDMSGRAGEAKGLHKYEKFGDRRVRSSRDPKEILSFSFLDKKGRIANAHEEFGLPIRAVYK